MLTPVSHVMGGFSALLDVAHVCPLLQHVRRVGADAWLANAAVIGVAATGSLSPTWREVERRAWLIAQDRLPSRSSAAWFSPADLRAAVISVGEGVAFASEVAERLLLEPRDSELALMLYPAGLQHSLYHRNGRPSHWGVNGAPIADKRGSFVDEDGGERRLSPVRREGSDGDKRIRGELGDRTLGETPSSASSEHSYTHGGQRLLSLDSYQTRSYRGWGVEQHLITWGGVLLVQENVEIDGLSSWAIVGRSSNADASGEDQLCDGAMLSAAHDAAPHAVACEPLRRPDTTELEQEPLLHSRGAFNGQYYHTLAEHTQTVAPLLALANGAAGLARSIQTTARTARMFEAWGLPLHDGVPLVHTPRARSLRWVSALLTVDAVPPNWPDALALLLLRETLRASVGLPAVSLGYLRRAGHPYRGGGESEDEVSALRRRMRSAMDEGERLDEGDADADRSLEEEGDVDADRSAAAVSRAWRAGQSAPQRRGALGSGDHHPCPQSAASLQPRPTLILLRRRSSRVLSNFEQLWAALNRTGVDIVVFDDHQLASWTAQATLRLFARAHVVVGTHGAGFTNVVASAPGTVLLELQSRGWRAPMFAHMAAALGLRYHRWILPGGSQYTPSLAAPVSGMVRVVCNAIAERLVLPG